MTTFLPDSPGIATHRRMNPFLSVCIPVLNGSNYITEAIESVLCQTSRGWELCISDNCSEDETKTICEGFATRDARVRYSRSMIRISAGANWDRAAKMARGTWFLMLGHDDLLDPVALASLQSTVPRHPSSRIIIANPLLIDAKGRPLKKQGGVLRHFQDVKTLSTDAFLDLLVEGMVCAPTGMFFSRSLLDVFGGFRHDLRGCADYEFCLRVCAGGDVTVLAYALSSYRIHENQDVRTYVVNQEHDPELLQQCMMQYKHLNDTHRRQLMANMVNSICRSVAFRIVEAGEQTSIEIASYRREVGRRIISWSRSSDVGRFLPKMYPSTFKLRCLWLLSSYSWLVVLIRPFALLLKTK